MTPPFPAPDPSERPASAKRRAGTRSPGTAKRTGASGKAGSNRGAVALAAQALAEASSQLRTALSKELGEAGADVTQKVAASLQEVARTLDDVATRVGPSDKAKRTREELLAAAARVFSARGYEGASVGEIAEDAGYTKGALYAHFGSKEQLFLELARTYSRQSVTETQEADTQGAPFIEWFCGSIPQALQAQPEVGLAVLNMEFILFGLRHADYRPEIVELSSAATRALARRLAEDRTGTAPELEDPTGPQDLDAAIGAAALSNELLLAYYLGIPGVDSDTAVRLLRRVTTPTAAELEMGTSPPQADPRS